MKSWPEVGLRVLSSQEYPPTVAVCGDQPLYSPRTPHLVSIVLYDIKGAHFSFCHCLSNRKFERLGDLLDEIVTVSVAQIQRHNATS